MNVFVLSTGRCGTVTFSRACSHLTNYTAAHESHKVAPAAPAMDAYRSLRYPPDHIEVDNRLTWFLGQLDEVYGDDAFYVHLLRDEDEVARSLAVRGRESILFGFACSVMQLYEGAARLSEAERVEIGRRYWEAANASIRLFLRGKSRQMTMWLDDVEDAFPRFLDRIGAVGDVEAAMREWRVDHNATSDFSFASWEYLPSSSSHRVIRRGRRIWLRVR